MGLFGVIGREAKGVFRSIDYDVRHSKRFRRLGVLAVATVAGGVVATGVLVRTPVPELIGMETEEGGAGVTDGWSGYGSDTQGQEAEASETPLGVDQEREEEEPPLESREQPSTEAGRSDAQAGVPGATPGLTPVEPTTGPAPEESESSTGPEPSETPTTAEPSPSETPSETPTPTKSPSESPTPSKTPAG